MDRRHGARELTRMALQALTRMLNRFESWDEWELAGFLSEAVKALGEARPSMASISNSLYAVVFRALNAKDRGLRESVAYEVNAQLRLLDESVKAVASNVANLVTDGNTVVTCSYSSTVLASLIEASRLGRRFRVLALHSPSLDGSIDYGEVTRERLLSERVETRVVNEAEVEKRMGEVVLAVVGADSILPDGSALNGTPSLTLAKWAEAHEAPFHVACETWKINPLPLMGFKQTVEPGMDMVSAKLITSIVTERGEIAPSKIREHAIEYLSRLKYVWSVLRFEDPV
ncbi:MAG: hypothetical protein QXO32_03990 [Candidatus Bathyarchaeia archaeon]